MIFSDKSRGNMNKKELKHILKPLIKECIKEVIFEEGALSNIISEVIKGTKVIDERVKSPSDIIPKSSDLSRKKSNSSKRRNSQLNANREKVLESLGKEAYGGVNIFEGTEAFARGGTPNAPSKVSVGSSSPPMFDDLDPSDPGVDISKFF